MGDERSALAYALASTDQRSARAWAAAIRGHWGIENRDHDVRDVSCHDDQSRGRDRPGIMAWARSTALKLLRKNGVTNVADALWGGALSIDRALRYPGA